MNVPPVGSKRRVLLDQLLAVGGKRIPFSVEFPDPETGEDVVFDVDYVDPGDPGVLANYHKVKVLGGDTAATLALWQDCKLPAALYDPDTNAKLPTAMKTAITNTLLERLGNELFQSRDRKLMIEAAALAMSEAVNISASKSPDSSEPIPDGSTTTQPPTPSSTS